MQEKGYEVVERNFYCSYGEIDVICKDGGYLVFVEVKYRKDARAGTPAEAVGPYKIRHIVKSAQYYLYRKGYPMEVPVRFDVVVIQGKDIDVIKNAFEAG